MPSPVTKVAWFQLDVRTLEFFPPTECWLVNSNFPRASRMQGTSFCETFVCEYSLCPCAWQSHVIPWQSRILSFPEPMCLLVSAETRSSGISSGIIHFKSPRFSDFRFHGACVLWLKKAVRRKNRCNLAPRAFSSTIFKMADRREKTLGNAELTPLLIGLFKRTRWLAKIYHYEIWRTSGRKERAIQEAVLQFISNDVESDCRYRFERWVFWVIFEFTRCKP